MRRLLARKFIPLYAVLALLVLAFASPLPSFATSQLTLLAHISTSHDNGKGEGSAQGPGNGGNNCGIKGDGTHDHGKTCPNYPYPGH